MTPEPAGILSPDQETVPASPADAQLSTCEPPTPDFAPSTRCLSEFSTHDQAMRYGQVLRHTPSKAGLFRRLYSSPQRVSPRLAIKAFCLECVWMDERAIRECTATACPLWNFRPYRKKVAAADDDHAATPG